MVEPERKGFGRVILKTIVPAVFGGTAELLYQPHGISWHLNAPLNDLLDEERKTLPAHGTTGKAELTVVDIGKEPILQVTRNPAASGVL